MRPPFRLLFMNITDSPMATISSPPTAGSDSVHVAEEGEAVGTVRAFAERMRLAPTAVLHCLRTSGASPILFGADGEDALLIVGPDGMDALQHCDADRALA
jgi:hypothetical protein